MVRYMLLRIYNVTRNDGKLKKKTTNDLLEKTKIRYRYTALTLHESQFLRLD